MAAMTASGVWMIDVGFRRDQSPIVVSGFVLLAAAAFSLVYTVCQEIRALRREARVAPILRLVDQQWDHPDESRGH